MKLTDLNPKWLGTGGEGVFHRDAATGELVPAPRREGVGVHFDCPCGRPEEGDHSGVFVYVDPPLDGGAPVDRAWKRTGDTFETLTLRPSIQRIGGCGWHGFVTNGEVSTC